MRVLVASGDAGLAGQVALHLRAVGMTVETVDLGEDALALARDGAADALVTGLDLDDLSTLRLIRRLRAEKLALPVMVMGGRVEVGVKVELLNAGADDILQIPFHRLELAARLGAMVRRAAGQPSAVVQLGQIDVDLNGRVAEVAGHRIHLTPAEYRMLEALVLRPGRTLSKEVLLGLMRDGLSEPEIKIVDVYVCKLRRKLGPAGRQIETVWGRGYRIGAEAVSRATGAVA